MVSVQLFLLKAAETGWRDSPLGTGPLPRLPTPGAKTLPLWHTAQWGCSGIPGVGTSPRLQNLAVMETSALLRHGNTTQIVTHSALRFHSHLWDSQVLVLLLKLLTCFY